MTSEHAMKLRWRKRSRAPTVATISYRRLSGVLLTVFSTVGCGIVAVQPHSQGPRPSQSSVSTVQPSLNECKLEDSPSVYVQGCVTLADGGNLDLDSGHLDVTTYDLRFQSGTLFPAAGTSLSYLGVTNFLTLSASRILDSGLATDSFDWSKLDQNG